MPHLLALLHGGATLTLSGFSVHWSTVIGLALFVALYAWRARQGLRVAGQPGSDSSIQPLGRTKPVLFGIGVLVMFFSLNGPLHDLSDSFLFSAHMLQHLLLAFVVAPLFIMGTPGWMLRPALERRGVAAAAGWLTRPRQAFAIFTVVFAGWHLPVAYNTAMAHHNVHIVMHLSMLAAAVIMWWPILSPLPELPRLSYPGQMLYLFLLTIPMMLISVYIAYADTVLYPAYASAPRRWGISPMNDQLIGALIMWIPGSFYFFTIISVVFFRWQQRDGDETVAGAQVDWAPETAARL
jgi:putative membrane protein